MRTHDGPIKLLVISVFGRRKLREEFSTAIRSGVTLLSSFFPRAMRFKRPAICARARDLNNFMRFLLIVNVHPTKADVPIKIDIRNAVRSLDAFGCIRDA